ncbi:hypothetical protein MMC07_007619 [Pseudocyphellaria aurata]|nr:hypothetical protein [Pseudocyphellaria aurata]
MQSAPPFLGSQLSRGSSTQVSWADWHFLPANPPHAGPTQIPGQSAPPFFGSQLSLGSSTHFWFARTHFLPVIPPHDANFVAARTERLGERATTGGGNTGSIKTQTPEQSRPPFFGSQSSLGLSTQVWPANGHGSPAMPPQKEPSLTAHMPGQSARGSQSGVLGFGMQVCPAAQGGRPRLPQIVGVDVGVGVGVDVLVGVGQCC